MLEKWEIPIPEGARIGPPVPPGIHLAKVSGLPELTTSSKGTRQLRFPVTVSSGEHEGKSMDVYRPLGSPRAWGRLMGTLDALKVKYEADPVSRKLKFDPAEFLGKECKIRVERRSWQGRDRTRVTDIFPPDAEVEVGVEEVPDLLEE